MSVSSIEWTDVTWNPVRGCTRVSEGCRNCYAETMAARNLPEMRSPTTGKPFAVRTPGGPRWTGAVELIPSKLDEPLHWRAPRRVFVNSMSDLFHEALPDEAIDQVFGVMAIARDQTFQVLTKRADRLPRYLARARERVMACGRDKAEEQRQRYRDWRGRWPCNDPNGVWPLTNVWLGVSVEDQATADERIPLLLQTPAAVRFVSYEPALAPVDFSTHLGLAVNHDDLCGLLNWLIVGGESGPGARPFHASWARSVRNQCRKAGCAYFLKQMGANVLDRNDMLATDRPSPFPDFWPEPEEGWDDGPRGNLERIDDGYQGAPLRLRLRDRKGGDMAEWPEDLRVREFPA